MTRADGHDDELSSNGIEFETGRPLPLPESMEQVAQTATEVSLADEPYARARRMPAIGAKTLGTDSSVDDAEDLADAGWGIVFPASVDASAVKEALEPLLSWRKKQAEALFRIFEGEAGVKLGENPKAWLARQGSGPGFAAVDPSQGVPYYLLIVASPEEVPMSFQYRLDIFWAVGRLHFDNLEDYAKYAKAVAGYEQNETPQKIRRATMFATQHAADRATAMFMRDVVQSFLDPTQEDGPLGSKQGFAMQTMLKEEATKANLLNALRGDGESAPSLLISGSHGMAFGLESKHLEECQGALICSDWMGPGSISEKDWFSAADLPSDLNVDGMIHFLFACYGGGWERVDTFRTDPNGQPRIIAKRPAIAKLPSGLLGRGALAVIAHVDRAFCFSFQTIDKRRQNYAMRDVLTKIMNGRRVGNAIDTFNMRWAATSTEIADAQRDLPDDAALRREIAKLWIARDDLRNYTVLGDPATFIRTDQLGAQDSARVGTSPAIGGSA